QLVARTGCARAGRARLGALQQAPPRRAGPDTPDRRCAAVGSTSPSSTTRRSSYAAGGPTPPLRVVVRSAVVAAAGQPSQPAHRVPDVDKTRGQRGEAEPQPV